MSADNFFKGRFPVPLLKKRLPKRKISAFWSRLVKARSGWLIFETHMVIGLVRVVKVVKANLRYRTCARTCAR